MAHPRLPFLRKIEVFAFMRQLIILGRNDQGPCIVIGTVAQPTVGHAVYAMLDNTRAIGYGA